MYSIENFCAFNVRCFSDPQTFFNSELLSIYGHTVHAFVLYVFSVRNPQAALEYAKQTISDVLCNRIDISQLVISKELTKVPGSKEYKDGPRLAHVELAQRWVVCVCIHYILSQYLLELLLHCIL